MMDLRQLGCSTGTLQDFGPDFGLTYVLDGLSVMGQNDGDASRSTCCPWHCRSPHRLRAAATEGLASLPLPAPGIGTGGYTLTAVFANALNLPASAKVKLAGADIGRTRIDGRAQLHRGHHAAHHGRRPLPAGSTAELRSATPLGDVFVALKPPARRTRRHRC